MQSSSAGQSIRINGLESVTEHTHAPEGLCSCAVLIAISTLPLHHSWLCAPVTDASLEFDLYILYTLLLHAE